jgi:hypothetical protein
MMAGDAKPGGAGTDRGDAVNGGAMAAPVYTLTLVLIGAGVLATFPPVWGLL